MAVFMTGLLARLSRKARGDSDKRAPSAANGDDAKAAALVAQAIVLHRAERLAEADALYQRVLTAEPANFDALHMSGVVAQQLGDAERAIDLMQRAAVVAPNNAAVHNNIGLVQITRERFAEAEVSLRKAVDLRPDWDRAHANLGIALRKRGNTAGAEIEFAASLRLNPANADAMSNLATLYRELRRYDDAERLYLDVLAIRPEVAEIWDNLGMNHVARERFLDAERCFRLALTFDGRMWRAHSNLAFVLLQLDRVEEAEQSCRDALALRADCPDALVNLASVLRKRGDASGATQHFMRALAADPTHVPAHVNLGSLQLERGQIAAAEASFREALRLDPGSVAARYNLAQLQLKRGAYREGFALFEGRFDAFPREARRERIAAIAVRDGARWRGDPLVGRRLLVWTEQGYGDCLMMLRYLPLLKARGADEVIVLCEPALERICRDTPGVDRVLTNASDVADGTFDVHCPIMSLPHHFSTTLDTVPAKVPFFMVPPALVETWRQRLSGNRKRLVGLAWAGSPKLREDAKRSMPLALLDPLRALPGIQLISLQKGVAGAKAASWDADVLDFMDACDDFMDTAALIANLDLVISVDTAVAHLAGALGIPVWLLNRFESEWRWGFDSDRSAWYPSMRIFRQPQQSEWVPVIRRICEELRATTQTRALSAAAANQHPNCNPRDLTKT